MNDKSFIAKLKMLEMGVVPAFTGHELIEMLSSMDPEARRISKRKFRKQWRKIMRQEPHLAKILTSGHGQNPNKAHKRNRACIYIARIIEQTS